MKNIKYTENRVKFLLLPILVIVVGIVMLFTRGFNFDTEFVGGIRMQINVGSDFENQEIADLVTEVAGEVAAPVVQKIGDGTQATIKMSELDDETKTKLEAAITEKYGEEAVMSVNSASASFGAQVQRKALIYTIIAILCILAYIAVRFEVKSAVMAVFALAINVLVMMAVYAITYKPLNTTFIAAMLTVVGYSINNTIVIFDRIRENMRGFNAKKGHDVAEFVDRSINESMGRTINTTITTLITVILLNILGVNSIKDFAFPLIAGVIAGAYTSIFVASPFWAAWKKAEVENKKQ
ncbi:MAG: protein translocase subunit SecF [Ruminococcaceae bacterium]|nr:protein translocase subunit SecF [Oscillospiraceae bacterium]